VDDREVVKAIYTFNPVFSEHLRSKPLIPFRVHFCNAAVQGFAGNFFIGKQDGWHLHDYHL